MNTRKLTGAIAVFMFGILAGVVWAQLTDDELVRQVQEETSQGVVTIPVPGPDDPPLRPVQRVPRAQYGVVNPAPLSATDLNALIFPDADLAERQAVLEGLTFFTTEQSAATGAGAVSNQLNCLGCHTSSNEAVPGLVTTISQASRAARSSPTNFAVTGLGLAADNDDAVNNTGKTASFTIFGNFCAGEKPCERPSPQPPIAIGAFDGLAQFFGFVQHTRPTVTSCPADTLPSLVDDPNLPGRNPDDDWMGPTGFRRQTAERAAPPYIGRGLMEAVPDDDILALADPDDTQNELDVRRIPGCNPGGDCISGRPNFATTNQTLTVGGDAVPRLGRFGLRAQGPQLIVFPSVGAQEEVGTTSAVRLAENIGPAGCADGKPDPDIPMSTIFSLRSLVRMTTLPEFGATLLELLQSRDPAAQRPAGGAAARVQRGATLFGVDLVAFANRMIPNRMPPEGDGRDMHARIVGDDDHDGKRKGKRKFETLNCAVCHTPVQRTGKSPADVGAEHLSFVWAPIFSDLLLHNMPVINAERFAPTARLPLLVRRVGLDTFDLPRNFGEDALPNQGTAAGDEFRTAPLMGLGRMGPPFLHDARVYLSQNTAETAPASTVMTNRQVTNAPLVVRKLDDAIRAAIELHDLPARGPGCPVPLTGSDGLVRVGDVFYGSPAAARQAICPPADSPTRSEAREVIRQYRALSPADQQALIDFLKQL